MQKIRRLPLHHACNVRDLGGYAIDDHKMTAWHQLYRSDSLEQLDEHDWNYLVNLNVKWIIDLRSKNEAQQMPYDCESYGIHYVSLPFMKEDKSPKELLDDEARKQFLDSMKLQYEIMIQDIPEEIVKAMDIIANALTNHEAVLFHCTAGKDRTGMLSTLLLSLCGVDKYDILADYQVSATYNTIGVNQMLPEEMMQIPAIKALFESTPSMMEPLIDMLNDTGCEQYLLNIGCEKASLNTIKDHFIDER